MEAKHTCMDTHLDTHTKSPLTCVYVPYLCWGDLSLSLFVPPERAEKKQNVNMLIIIDIITTSIASVALECSTLALHTSVDLYSKD